MLTRKPNDVARLERRPSPVLVGREQELAILREAATRPPAIVLIEGEAGIGKSRLVREVLSDGAVGLQRPLLGHCHPLLVPFPLGPLVEALGKVQPPTGPLSPLAASLRPVLPELSAHLPPAIEPARDPRVERHRVFRAIRELIAALDPTVCVVEDLHWADGETIDLLGFLASEVPSSLSLFLTYRREDLSSRAASLISRLELSVPTVKLVLSPITPSEVRRLTAAVLETEDVSEGFATYLHERASGIPFAVEEIVHLLQDRRELVCLENPWARRQLDSMKVPPAFLDATHSRLRLLPGHSAAILHAAAVLQLPSDEKLLTKVGGLSHARARGGLIHALSSGFLEESEDGRYRMRHVLVAEAVYESIPRPQRRHLHLRAALALEALSEPRPYGRLVHHFREAGQDGKWLKYSENAAEAAREVGDDAFVAQCLGQALCAPKLSRAASARMCVRYGAAALFGRQHTDAIPILLHTLESHCFPSGIRGEIRLLLGRLLLQSGDAPAANKEFVLAAGELRCRPELACRAMAYLAWPSTVEGELSDHLGWLQRAMATSARHSDRLSSVASQASQASVLVGVGSATGWEVASNLPWDSDRYDEQRELVRAAQRLAFAAMARGYHRRADGFLDVGERICHKLHHSELLLGLATARALLDWSEGRWEGLEDRTNGILERTSDNPHLALILELVVTSLLVAHGGLSEARRRLISVHGVALTSGLLPVFVRSSGDLARVELLCNRPEAARRAVEPALVLIRRKKIWAWATGIGPVAVDALIACERQAEASEFVDEFGNAARNLDAPSADASLVSCRASIEEAGGQLQDAVQSFQRAEEIWCGLPHPYRVAHTLERRARCLLAMDDSHGEKALLDAFQAFKNLGAAADAGRVRSTLRREQIPLPWRGGRSSYGMELSPREAEVAELAGRGFTAKEIAERLFLSPRTVESHVAAARRKVGAGSKRALGAFQQQR